MISIENVLTMEQSDTFSLNTINSSGKEILVSMNIIRMCFKMYCTSLFTVQHNYFFC